MQIAVSGPDSLFEFLYCERYSVLWCAPSHQRWSKDDITMLLSLFSDYNVFAWVMGPGVTISARVNQVRRAYARWRYPKAWVIPHKQMEIGEAIHYFDIVQVPRRQYLQVTAMSQDSLFGITSTFFLLPNGSYAAIAEALKSMAVANKEGKSVAKRKQALRAYVCACWQADGIATIALSDMNTRMFIALLIKRDIEWLKPAISTIAQGDLDKWKSLNLALKL